MTADIYDQRMLFLLFTRRMTADMILVTVLLSVLCACDHLGLTEGQLYSLSAKDINGKNVSLEEFQGMVSLVVNVASECGYTDHNYRELVQLQTELQSTGFIILAFPSNQFGQQEPETNENIVAFTRSKYKVNFPLFSKSEDLLQESVVYQHLVGQMKNEPSWNFCKYLVDNQGEVVQFFSEKDDFSKIRNSIDYLLKKAHSEEL